MDLPAELFSALFPFQLDEFQLQALRALGRRRNVVVSAPTGSGKTVLEQNYRTRTKACTWNGCWGCRNVDRYSCRGEQYMFSM